MEPDEFWLNQWDSRLDVWESTITAALALHFRRAERVALEKLGGVKVARPLAKHYADLAAGLVEPLFFDEKAAKTPAARSAAARLAWATRRGLGSGPSTAPAATHTHAPTPSAAAPHPAPTQTLSRTGLTAAQLQARAMAAAATRRANAAKKAQGAPTTPTTPPPSPAPPMAPVGAPNLPSTPTAPFTVPPGALRPVGRTRQSSVAPGDLTVLSQMGNAGSAQAHTARRKTWIGRDPARRELADAAGEWIGDLGDNQRYTPIRKAADAVMGSRRGNVRTPKDLDRAKALMAAAADGPLQPKMYRGVALTDAELSQLAVGQTRIEALGSWTDNRQRGLGYGSFRTRGQTQNRNGNRNIVLFELDDGHGVGVSPLSKSSYPAYFDGEEFLSSGLYETTAVTQTTDTPPWMDAYGMRPGPNSTTVTVVKLRQLAVGFDVAAYQPGSKAPLQVDEKAVGQARIRALRPDGSLWPLDPDEYPRLPGGEPPHPEFTADDFANPTEAELARLVEDLGIDLDDPLEEKMLGQWVGIKAINPFNLFNPVDWARGLIEDAKDWFAAILGDFATSVALILDVPFTLAKQVIDTVAGRQAGRLSKAADTTAHELEDTLAAGESLGESGDELAARVSAVFDRAVTQRAPVIATTEVSTAANNGSYLAAWQAQIKVEKTWWTRLDNRVRPTHQAAHGQRRDLNDKFQVGRGELMFPSDPTGPLEEIINCRCRAIMVPVTTMRPTKGFVTGISRGETLSDRLETKAAVRLDGISETPEFVTSSIAAWFADPDPETKTIEAGSQAAHARTLLAWQHRRRGLAANLAGGARVGGRVRPLPQHPAGMKFTGHAPANADQLRAKYGDNPAALEASLSAILPNATIDLASAAPTHPGRLDHYTNRVAGLVAAYDDLAAVHRNVADSITSVASDPKTGSAGLTSADKTGISHRYDIGDLNPRDIGYTTVASYTDGRQGANAEARFGYAVAVHEFGHAVDMHAGAMITGDLDFHGMARKGGFDMIGRVGHNMGYAMPRSTIQQIADSAPSPYGASDPFELRAEIFTADWLGFAANGWNPQNAPATRWRKRVARASAGQSPWQRQTKPLAVAQ